MQWILLLIFVPWIAWGLDTAQVIEEVLHNYFGPLAPDTIMIESLEGGCEALNYRISAGEDHYVLHIFNQELGGEETTALELYTMEEAARKGISPSVRYVTRGKEAVLMDYIFGKTASLEEAKRKENIPRIAAALRSLHQIDKHPITTTDFATWSVEFYEKLLKLGKANETTTKVTAFVQKKGEELAHCNGPKAVIHGDLNPRNIFFEPEVQIIDWTYTRWDDPLFDLSCFALYHNYDPEQERALLEAYLERDPTQDEVRRYQLTKQILMANLYLNLNHYFWLGMKGESASPMDESSSPKDLSWHMETFSLRDFNPTLQFFYDWAQAYLATLIELSDL